MKYMVDMEDIKGPIFAIVGSLVTIVLMVSLLPIYLQYLNMINSTLLAGVFMSPVLLLLISFVPFLLVLGVVLGLLGKKYF
jgi:hypothetical protein